MRKGAAAASVVDLQVPDDRCQQDDRRIDEEVALLLDPRLVQVQHDGIGRLVGVRDVGHELRGDRITAIRAAGVVEVDDAEARPRRVGIQMVQQVVVGQQRQVVELEIVDIHGKALLDLLADVAVHHGVGLARAGGSQHHCRPEGVDDVNHPRPPLAPVVVAGRKVDRVFVFEQTRLLFEALVVVVEGVAGKGRMQQAAGPHPGGQQRKVAAQQGQHIAPETKLQPRGKAPQRIVAEEQEETGQRQEEDLPLRGFPVPHAACAVASQHQKEEGAEFRDG